VYHDVEKRVRAAIGCYIHKVYNIDVRILTERPPRIEMGEIATPVCFDLAKQLKKSPRILAQEIANKVGPIEGVARFEVAGAGYLNAYLDRAAFFSDVAAKAGNEAIAPTPRAGKAMVEHTSVNPNKAAHIGHLRNAIMGDTFARLLRHAGHTVEVQNYIDNTGVQVADVVIGFIHLEGKSAAEVLELTQQPRFDYLCWDLYARAGQFLEGNPDAGKFRSETLHAIEAGVGGAAEIGAIVADAIVQCHLRTLDRLGIDFDLLSQESEILRLNFWQAAFDLLKAQGTVHLATTGKNAGCWVMRLPTEAGTGAAAAEAGAEAAPVAEESTDDAADAKVIVRSSGTVTYVGKDIAYHLWKFGLLGRDFHYKKAHTHPDGHVAWVTTTKPSEADAPAFGHAQKVFNVIDSRQIYPQVVVALALRALGHPEAADNLFHISYDVVALTVRCATELGYAISAEDAKRGTVEVSGRKGQGVIADDLLDRLESHARAEVDSRHPDFPADERGAIAHSIAVGALRYFLLKFTRTSIINFDFEDALSFEGETGPYVQYAAVRARNIFRKMAEQQPDFRRAQLAGVVGGDGNGDSAAALAAPDGNSLWELILLAGLLGNSVQGALNAKEPAGVARYAFQLAQAFNLFYHKHHILSEPDAAKRMLLLQIADVAEKQLVAALGLLGIDAPEKM
jgi:arginyl-tRNA synthetase